MAKIHPTACVSPQAELAANIRVGPFTVIEDDVVIGDDCEFAARVSVKAGTRMGCGNVVSEGALIGGPPQHKRAEKQYGLVSIGSGNIIRENATIHCGLSAGEATRIGDQNLIMVNAHVGHDCVIGNEVIVVNNSMLAGHVEVGDHAYLGGAMAIHQFCRIGRLAMVGGQAHLAQDVPPFVTVDGNSSLIVGLNLIGLRRAGFAEQQIRQLKAAYRVIYRSGRTWSDTLKSLQDNFADGPAAEFAPFLKAGRRGFVRERRTPRAATLTFPAKASPAADKESARKAG